MSNPKTPSKVSARLPGDEGWWARERPSFGRRPAASPCRSARVGFTARGPGLPGPRQWAPSLWARWQPLLLLCLAAKKGKIRPPAGLCLTKPSSSLYVRGRVLARSPVPRPPGGPVSHAVPPGPGGLATPFPSPCVEAQARSSRLTVAEPKGPLSGCGRVASSLAPAPGSRIGRVRPWR